MAEIHQGKIWEVKACQLLAVGLSEGRLPKVVYRFVDLHFLLNYVTMIDREVLMIFNKNLEADD